MTRFALFVDTRILAVTYNVNGQTPNKTFDELLGYRSDFYGRDELPDLYAIGCVCAGVDVDRVLTNLCRLQEVSVKASNIILEEPWVKQVKDVLVKWDYVKLKQIRVQGILLLLFTKRHLITEFRNVQTAVTRTGLHGLWGNKGGVSIRMSVSGVSLCIVNTHLPAHEDKVDDRIRDYNEIVDSQRFIDPQTTGILSHE